MDGADFDDLFQTFPTTVRWEASHPCPCTKSGGGANLQCLVCFGTGYWFDPISHPFEVTIIGQDARARAAIAQTMGPGEMGDSVLLVPRSALCYSAIRERDKVYDMMRMDTHRLVLNPGPGIRLPWGVCDLRASVLASDLGSIESVVAPVPDVHRRVTVSKATALDFKAPRAYQIIRDLAKVRTFGSDLPKRFSVKLIDLSVR